MVRSLGYTQALVKLEPQEDAHIHVMVVDEHHTALVVHHVEVAHRMAVEVQEDRVSDLGEGEDNLAVEDTDVDLEGDILLQLVLAEEDTGAAASLRRSSDLDMPFVLVVCYVGSSISVLWSKNTCGGRRLDVTDPTVRDVIYQSLDPRIEAE